MVTAWVAIDRPSREVFDLVTNWLLDRLDTPHDGVAAAAIDRK